MMDEALLRFYHQVRRVARLVVSMLPIIVLLVGSCKTSLLPAAYGGNDGSKQFRVALFPDQVNFKGMSYYPAEGYIARAQKYVSGAPDALNMLTQQEVTYILGAPAMTRHDADAVVWQYKSESCIVDVYFYKKSGDHAPSAVSYVDMRPNSLADKTFSDRMKSKCLARVMEHPQVEASASRI